MSDTVHTVGDLSGKHVGVETIRIESGSTVVVGVMSELTFSAQYELTLSGEQFYDTLAYIRIEDHFELRNITLDTPASIVA